MNAPQATEPVEITIDPSSQVEAPIGPDSVELGYWQSRLILFQRIVGGFMMAKGLVHWAVLFSGASFQAMTIEARSATVFFAVIDLIAAVALWLGSPWGAAVWLMAVLSQVVASFVFVSLSGLTLVLTVLELLLVAFYMLLRIKAHTEDERYR